MRHAEVGVPIPEPWRCHAINWLENEQIDWEEETIRRLRRIKEIDLLKRASQAKPSDKRQAGASNHNPPDN